MGCCFSTPKAAEQQNGPKSQQCQLRSPKPATHEVDSRAPPPVEEETVKEVLSETPVSKPQVPFLVGEKIPQMPIIQPQAEKFEPKGLIKSAEEVSDVTQLSEICSMSEKSFSTTTTATTATITEKREDEATSKRSSREGSQRSNRSPSIAPGKGPNCADSTNGREPRAKSPACKVEPPPEKSQGSSRSVRGRESGQVGSRKLNAGSAGVRRDPCEGSGRRSRSPSTRSVGGVSKVSSNGRSQLKLSGGAGRPLPAKDVENSVSDLKVEEKNDAAPQESLENPHVSMECFIFL